MITKIRKNKGLIQINYDRPNPSNKELTDDITLKTEEPPRPEFDAALQGLLPHLLDILQLDSDYGDSLTITSLSISEKGGARKIVIGGKKDLINSNSPFNISTPPMQDVVAGEDATGENCLSDEAIKAIDLMIEEGKKFIKGERGQGTLELDGD